MAGHAFHASRPKTMTNAMAAQTISFVSGTIGFFAFTSSAANTSACASTVIAP